MTEKNKLSIEEQILDMQHKGITFTVCDIPTAKRYLRDNTYYFKIKSYSRVYEQYLSTAKAGQYINLDFAYLQELAILDMYFRKVVLELTIDLEHALKTALIYDVTTNEDEDGYKIVQKYLSADYLREKRIFEKIGKSAVSDLISSHKDNDRDFAIWELVEVLSFGDFIDIYQLYYNEYPQRKESYSNYLWAIKYLRNAAAHNNCLLNSIRSPYIVQNKNKQIAYIVSKVKGISSDARDKWLKNTVVHDFIILVFVYLNAVKSAGIKSKGIEKLKWFFKERAVKHKEYFLKNNSLTSCYAFTNRIIDNFCNKYRVN